MNLSTNYKGFDLRFAIRSDHRFFHDDFIDKLIDINADLHCVYDSKKC